MVTLRDVAGAARVTPSVVSRVLNHDATLRIRPETRDRILAAVEEFNYIPNGTARALRMSRTGTLGLVTHDLTNPVYGEMVRGAHRAASQAGYQLLLGDADELNRDLTPFDAMLRGGRIDGLLLMRSTRTSDSELAGLAARTVPTVLLLDTTRPGVSAVRTDDAAGVRAGVEHLIALGHRRIAHLTGLPSFRSQQRHQGYLEALRVAGIRVRRDWVATGGWDANTGRTGMTTLLDRTGGSKVRPTAVFVSNILAGMGALAAARDAGLTIPTDLSVVALHDAWLADVASPPLTTVRMPLNELGQRAVAMVLEGNSSEDREVLVTEPEPVIVPRASTATYPG